MNIAERIAIRLRQRAVPGSFLGYHRWITSHRGLRREQLCHLTRNIRFDNNWPSNKKILDAKQKSSKILPLLLHTPFSCLRILEGTLQHRGFSTNVVTKEKPVFESGNLSDASEARRDSPCISFYSSSVGKTTNVNSISEIPAEVWGSIFSKVIHKVSERETAECEDSNTYWLDVTCPTVCDIDQLCRELALHRLTKEDILSKETQEKLEVHERYSFISYSAFDPDRLSSRYLHPVNMYILTLPKATVSIRSHPWTLSNQMENRLDRFKESETLSPDWLTYALIDEVTDEFVLALKNIRATIQNLSESSLSGKDTAYLLKSTAHARKELLTMRQLFGNKLEVVKALLKRQDKSVGQPRSELGLNLSDVEDHLNAVSRDLNHWEEVLSHSENNCLMQLNLRMTQANNEASEAISKLTVLSTVILPLNVITGLWGMNVMVPGQGIDTLHWFSGLASLMVLVASTGYWWATRFLKGRYQ